MEKFLSQEGHQAEQAEHGLFLALQKDIDAFVVDLQMPGIDGLELCRRLHSVERYRLTPLVVLTAGCESERMYEVLDAGADGYLVKPVSAVGLSAR